MERDRQHIPIWLCFFFLFGNKVFCVSHLDNKVLNLIWEFRTEKIEMIEILDTYQNEVLGIHRGTKFEVLERFKDRLIINKTDVPNNTGERITVTILNPTSEDLIAEYAADVIVQGGVEKTQIQPDKQDLFCPASVTSTLGRTVELKWKYNRNKTSSCVVFSRGKPSLQSERLADWSMETNYQVSRPTSYWLQMRRKLSDDGKSWNILLTIKESVRSHYDWTYFCHILMDDGTKYEAGIELRLQSPIWTDTNIYNVTAKLGDSVMFQWQYEYRFKANAVVFRKIDMTQNVVIALGFWFQNVFNIDDNYKGRITSIVKNSSSGETITLTILQVEEEDFNFGYGCYITLQDGQNINWKTDLVKDVSELFESTTINVEGTTINDEGSGETYESVLIALLIAGGVLLMSVLCVFIRFKVKKLIETSSRGACRGSLLGVPAI